MKLSEIYNEFGGKSTKAKSVLDWLQEEYPLPEISLLVMSVEAAWAHCTSTREVFPYYSMGSTTNKPLVRNTRAVVITLPATDEYFSDTYTCLLAEKPGTLPKETNPIVHIVAHEYYHACESAMQPIGKSWCHIPVDREYCANTWATKITKEYHV